MEVTPKQKVTCKLLNFTITNKYIKSINTQEKKKCFINFTVEKENQLNISFYKTIFTKYELRGRVKHQLTKELNVCF